MIAKSPIPPSPLSRRVFLWRLTRSIIYGCILLFCSLLIGMVGYHHFESMPWIDSFANASMILSGMGPLTPMHTDGGKIFAGIYALFSGVLFLVVIAIIFAPIVHHFLHKFHLDDDENK